MSKPATPAPAPVPTRRQLDELEVLLQRMLELPVRPEQETPLPPNAPQGIQDRTHEIFHETPSEWDDATNEAAAIERSPAQYSVDSPLILVDSPPEFDSAWDGADVHAGDRYLPSGHEANSEIPEADQFPETGASNWPSEITQPEPGIIRILLGWTGLLCLIISLAILFLDWYGWTW